MMGSGLSKVRILFFKKRFFPFAVLLIFTTFATYYQLFRFNEKDLLFGFGPGCFDCCPGKSQSHHHRER